MNKMKKVLVTCILLSVGLLSAACGKVTQDNSNDTIENKNNLSGKVDIWVSARDQDIINNEAAMFKKKYPNVQININTVDTNIMMDNLSKNLKSKGDTPDIISLEDEDIDGFVSKFKDELLDEETIPDFKSDSYVKYQIYNATYGSKIYAVPWYVDPVFMAYREDLLKSTGYSGGDIKYWDQYINIAKNSGKQMLSMDYFNNSLLYNIALKQLGINYFDDNNKLDLEASIKPAELLWNLYENKSFYNATNKVSNEDNFENGNTMSIISDLSELRKLETKYPKLQGKIDVEKLPAFEAGGNRDAVEFGEDLMALKSAAKNKAAMEFLNYISSSNESAEFLYNNYGYVSSNTSLYNNTKYYITDGYYNKSIGRIAIDEITNSENIKYGQYFGEIRDLVQNAIKDSVTNGSDLKQNIYNVQNTIKALNID